ncbi:MAG: hypothetical protein DMG96_41290 [Acidobacteria bacterium]|nr:MAG: hypothetical protein DMG96_41290 [Acidobacteriota bacterium]
MDSGKRAAKAIEIRRAAIQRKIHPALPELLKAFREAETAWKSLRELERTPERVREIQQKMDAELDSIRRRYSGPVQASKGTFGVEGIYSETTLRSESQTEYASVAEYVHWHRHSKPLETDLEKMQAKDYEASTRVQRTFGDLEILRCGGGRPKPFKGGAKGTDHWDFFAMGWGLGLEHLNLTPEELADFANLYCICGSTEHDADNLKQQRLRFKRARENAMGRIREHAD